VSLFHPVIHLCPVLYNHMSLSATYTWLHPVYLHRARFEILTLVVLKIQFFCDLTPYRLVDNYGSFGTACYLHLQNQRSPRTSSKTLVPIYQSTRGHVFTIRIFIRTGTPPRFYSSSCLVSNLSRISNFLFLSNSRYQTPWLKEHNSADCMLLCLSPHVLVSLPVLPLIYTLLVTF
jgi:hypothetical protein